MHDHEPANKVALLFTPPSKAVPETDGRCRFAFIWSGTVGCADRQRHPPFGKRRQPEGHSMPNRLDALKALRGWMRGGLPVLAINSIKNHEKRNEPNGVNVRQKLVARTDTDQ